MRLRIFTLLCANLLFAIGAPASAADYFPPPAPNWDRLSPAEGGFNPDKLDEAIRFAIDQEVAQPRDLALALALSWAKEPYDAIIGPTEPRGAPTGLILRHGYVVAQWGEPDRADMTFSVAKSFLSTLAGIALERHLIAKVEDPVRNYLPGEYFQSPHNYPINWNHLLRQTSNWQGTLWGKPDWADRPTGNDPFAWPNLSVAAPGQAWKYNDVRVNLLALALLQVWREPLPQVLKREVMDKIGASTTWHWHGYHNSSVELDGKRVESVSGGGHWGGGMFISAWDQARFGLLCLRHGQWSGQRIYSEEWYKFASTPTPQNPEYGVMNWYLNTNQKLLPSAPASAITHLGAGTNMIYVDPEHDLIVVARWIKSDAMDGVVQRVLAALTSHDKPRNDQSTAANAVPAM